MDGANVPHQIFREEVTPRGWNVEKEQARYSEHRQNEKHNRTRENQIKTISRLNRHAFQIIFYDSVAAQRIFTTYGADMPCNCRDNHH